MATIEEILRRRMRIPVPKEKKKVTWNNLIVFAIPYLWALIYLVDQTVIFFHLPVSWFHELLFFFTAVAFFLAFVFSPRDDVIPWEKVSEPRQRSLFFIACACAITGIVLLWFFGAGFWIYMNLALAILTLFWLVLPYFALSGNLGALKLLLFSMRLGIIWWTSTFVLYVIRDGSSQIMNNNFPAGALAFLGLTYWWFLKSANFLISDEVDKWPSFFSKWALFYWLGLALSGSLVLIWIFTGFTNTGVGWYGTASYQLPFPFYDVSAFLEPFSLSNGNLLLLHSIPWKKLLFLFGAIEEKNSLHMLSGLHWLGLVCLFIAVLGIFVSVSVGLKQRLTQLYAVLALLISIVTVIQTIVVWYQFKLSPKIMDYCPSLSDSMSIWGCEKGNLEGIDHFMLMGQHIPTIFCACVAIVFAIFLLFEQRKLKHDET